MSHQYRISLGQPRVNYKEWDGDWKCNKVDGNESATTSNIIYYFVVNVEVDNNEGTDLKIISCINHFHKRLFDQFISSDQLKLGVQCIVG